MAIQALAASASSIWSDRMDEDQPSESQYWEACARACEDLAWSSGPEQFLDSFLAVPNWLRVLIAADWCQKEICNGGMLQFFTNSTGIVAPEAIEGFRALGLSECAKLLEEGIKIRDQDEREEFEERFPGEERSQWDPFYRLDAPFYVALGRDNDRFDQAAQAYYLKNVVK
jgi:hypothetical protein